MKHVSLILKGKPLEMEERQREAKKKKDPHKKKPTLTSSCWKLSTSRAKQRQVLSTDFLSYQKKKVFP